MQLIVLALLLIIVPTTTFAYFDPGTGSLLIQALIGGLAAVTVFWGRLKTYVRSLFSTQADRPSPVSASTDNQAKKATDTEE